MFPVDIAIITIREDEYSAILKRFTYEMKVEHNRTYAIASVTHRLGFSYRVGIVRCVEVGPNAGQDTARDLIEDLDPQWIAVVGIGGAFPDPEFTLGDVVVASRLYDFTVSARFEDAPTQFVNQGGPMSKTIQDLVASLGALNPQLAEWQSDQWIKSARPSVDLAERNFYGSTEWRDKTLRSLERYFGNNPLRSKPEITVRSVATSGALIKDTAVAQTWLTTGRDLALVEMELGGVYVAARRKSKEYPVLAVRGISDIVGFIRSPEWTRYACDTAAAALVAILQNLPDKMLIPRRVPVSADEMRSASSCDDVETDPSRCVRKSDFGTHRDQEGSDERASSWRAHLPWVWRFGITWRDLILTPSGFFGRDLNIKPRYTNPWLFYLASIPLLDCLFGALFLALCFVVDSEMPIGTWTEVLEINRFPSLVPLVSTMVMSLAMLLYGILSGGLRTSRPLSSLSQVLSRFLYAGPASTLALNLSVIWFLACIALIFILVSSLPSPPPLSMQEFLDLVNHEPTIMDTAKEAMSGALGILVGIVVSGPLLVSIVVYEAFAIRGLLKTTRVRAWIIAITLVGTTMVVFFPISAMVQQVPLSETERNIAARLRSIKIVSGLFKDKHGRYGSLVELGDFSQASLRENAGDQSTSTTPADRDALGAYKAIVELNPNAKTSGYQLSFHRSKRFAYVDATPIKYSADTRQSFVLDCALGVAHVSDRRGARATLLDQILQLAP